MHTILRIIFVIVAVSIPLCANVVAQAPPGAVASAPMTMKEKMKARSARMKANWAESKARFAACRKKAEAEGVASRNRAVFLRDCARR